MKQIKIYKCSMCNNIVLKLKDENENLACCGKPMILMDANSTDGASEKHVPFVKGQIKKDPHKFEVQIGSVIHPMTPEHHIEWIAGFSDKTWTIKWLDPNEQPAKNLHIYDDTAIYEYCNLHGLWKK